AFHFLSDWNLWLVWKDHPGNKKASLEDPGGLDHDDCVKCLPSRRPPAGIQRKGKAESAQSCAVPRRELHVSVKGTDICRCDAHGRINAHQPLFCQWFGPSAWFMTAFLPSNPSVEKGDSPHFSLRQRSGGTPPEGVSSG